MVVAQGPQQVPPLQAAQRPFIPVVAQLGEEEPVGEGHLQSRYEVLLAERVVVLAVGDGAGGEDAGVHRVAESEPPERVLETGPLADEIPLSLPDQGRARAEGDVPAERPGALHREADRLAQAVEGEAEVPVGLLEVVEEAGGEGGAAVVDEEVGVAARGEVLVQKRDVSVGVRGLEDDPARDGIRPARPRRDDYRSRGRVLDVLAEADLDARRERLPLQALVERRRCGAPLDEVEQRSRRPDRVLHPRRSDGRPIAEGRAAEVGLDAERSDGLGRVLVRGPVFQPLKVAVEPRAHVRRLLDDDGSQARPGEGERRGEPCRPGSDDVDVGCAHAASPPRSSLRKRALIETMTVLADMNTAATAGPRRIPALKSTPAARGMAMML